MFLAEGTSKIFKEWREITWRGVDTRMGELYDSFLSRFISGLYKCVEGCWHPYKDNSGRWSSGEGVESWEIVC